MEEFELIAKTFQGLEEVLAKELTALGANNIEIGRRMVSFSGDKEMMYRANFALRTAIRILKPIKHFTANSADEVYEAIKAIEWEQYMDNKMSFAIDAVVFSDEFRHSKFVAYKVKDAIDKLTALTETSADALDGIKDTVNESATGVTDIAQKTSDMVEKTVDIHDKVTQCYGCADELNNIVAKFKLQ